MSKIISVIVALILGAVLGPAFAVATWEHFGADPAYQSRKAAIADAPRVLRQAGYPEAVIALLTEAMKNPGVNTHVTNGMKLDFMRSGKSALWRNVVVKFTKPPRESEKNMDFSAPSEEWTVDWNGAKWTAGIPKVCNNIYGRRPATPVPVVPSPKVEKKCVEHVFNAPIGGYVRWGIGTITGPLPPDECNAQRQDNLAWTSWYGECDICITAIGYIRSILGGSALVPHKYLYPVTHTRQTLRFSTEVWSKVVYICLEDATGRQSCGVYMRPQDWKARYHVDIPDSMWVWGNCPE